MLACEMLPMPPILCVFHRTTLQPGQRGILYVELYSGCGSHSLHMLQTSRAVFRSRDVQVWRITVDIVGTPDLLADARGFTEENLTLLKGKFPDGTEVIVLASPPCTGQFACVNRDSTFPVVDASLNGC